MKKRSNKVYPTGLITTGILETLAIIGAYAADYYTKTRMGMLRHVVYLNGKWEQTLPLQLLKYMALCAIIALVILGYLRYRKEKTASKATGLTAVTTAAVSGWTAYFLLFHNPDLNRAYYILSAFFILITVLQNILYHWLLSSQKQLLQNKKNR